MQAAKRKPMNPGDVLDLARQTGCPGEDGLLLERAQAYQSYLQRERLTRYERSDLVLGLLLAVSAVLDDFVNWHRSTAEIATRKLMALSEAAAAFVDDRDDIERCLRAAVQARTVGEAFSETISRAETMEQLFAPEMGDSSLRFDGALVKALVVSSFELTVAVVIQNRTAMKESLIEVQRTAKAVASTLDQRKNTVGAPA